MSEGYVEWLVKKPMSVGAKVLKGVLIAVTVGFVLIAMLGSLVAMLLAIACGVGAYFVGIYMDIEFEYLYLDKELTIDKVFAKTKRKTAAVFDINSMEMLAPLNSWHLDAYKNRDMKVVDYSSGVAQQPEQRYVMIHDNQKVILEPNMAIVKAIQTIAPRKVFTE